MSLGLLKHKQLLRRALPSHTVQELLTVRENLRFVIWRCLWKIRKTAIPWKYYSEAVKEDDILMLNPAKIIYRTNHEFRYYIHHGLIKGGNWDIPLQKFKDNMFYQSYFDRVNKATPWNETRYYNVHLKAIQSGEVRWGCHNKIEWDNRCKLLDSIFLDIEKNGYRQFKMEDYVSVNIGRNGNILFNDGRHRLTFCLIAQVPEIPVRITVRHAKWVLFKKQILNYANKKENRNGKVYAPLTHIDLLSIPSGYGHRRFELIKDNLSKKKYNKMLDIGSHWGYFCHKFEEIGYQCVAIENNPENLYFLQKLRNAEDKAFSIYRKSLFSIDIEHHFYDVVLALAVFHHFTKDAKSHSRLVRFLNKINAREMFFQPPNYNEPQMQTAYRNYNNEGFLKFIVANSNFKNYVAIGTAEDGRKLFKIW